MSQGGLSFMRPFWGFFYTPRRGRRVPPVLPTGVGSLFFREPMPAPPSVPARACIIHGGRRPRKRIPLVREKAGFTHDMTFFQHDVRGKRFSAHGRVILGSQQRFVRRWNNRTQIGAKYGFSHVIWSKYFIFRGNKSSFVDVFTI